MLIYVNITISSSLNNYQRWLNEIESETQLDSAQTVVLFVRTGLQGATSVVFRGQAGVGESWSTVGHQLRWMKLNEVSHQCSRMLGNDVTVVSPYRSEEPKVYHLLTETKGRQHHKEMLYNSKIYGDQMNLHFFPFSLNLFFVVWFVCLCEMRKIHNYLTNCWRRRWLAV